MKVKTLDGREYDLQQATLDSLRMRLKGSILSAGDAGYDESRTVWNAMIDQTPALVVRCLGTADVIACVQFARDNRLLLCIKGGGHNIAGLATVDGALMLDLSLMRGVWVDAQRQIAHAQAGCLLGDVDRETQLHGLATVLGFVSMTGIAGLTPVSYTHLDVYKRQQQVRQAGAVGRAPAMTHVQWPRRVGGHEFDLHFFSATER